MYVTAGCKREGVVSKQKDKSDADDVLNELLSSPKRRRFAIAFAENGGNGTKAAETAGFAFPAQEACRLLKFAEVRAAIESHCAVLRSNANESRETILDREANWARSNIKDYFERVPIVNAEGEQRINPHTGQPMFTEEMKPLSSLTDEQAKRIKKLSWNREGPVLELHDPMRANRNLAEYAGMLKQKVSDMTPVEAASAIHDALKDMDEVDGISSPDET